MNSREERTAKYVQWLRDNRSLWEKIDFTLPYSRRKGHKDVVNAMKSAGLISRGTSPIDVNLRKYTALVDTLWTLKL